MIRPSTPAATRPGEGRERSTLVDDADAVDLERDLGGVVVDEDLSVGDRPPHLEPDRELLVAVWPLEPGSRDVAARQFRPSAIERGDIDSGQRALERLLLDVGHLEPADHAVRSRLEPEAWLHDGQAACLGAPEGRWYEGTVTPGALRVGDFREGARHREHLEERGEGRCERGMFGGSALLKDTPPGFEPILASTVSRMVESVELLSHLANIGDTRSLIIHPASTTHRQLTEEQRVAAGAGPDVVRLSIGLETIDDIIADLAQALDHATKQPTSVKAAAE